MTIACNRTRGGQRRARAAVAMFPLPPSLRVDGRLGRTLCFGGALAASTALASLLGAPAFAAPQGGSVVAGSATISSSGTTTTIDQSSNKAIINWTSFSVGKQETVDFNQPSASSVTLNRVIGNEGSVIAGAINANGQVFIVNSNGILFTGTSQVNVGGLVASTLDISNQDFLAGNYVFSGASTNSVVNKGSLSAAPGGYVSLMGKTVSNQGVITATLGTVSLNAGSKITLNFDGNSLVDVSIDEGVLNALVENRQLIRADGGKVILTAKAADAVLSAQVNNSGTIQARTMAQLTGGTTSYRKGSIKLKADGGTTKVSGTLDASAPNGGDGGSIETSGNSVKVDDAATITTAASLGATGTWLIDPDGFTIGTFGFRFGPLDQISGLDLGGDMSARKLSQTLETTNVEIRSTDGQGQGGNVNVNAKVSWAANTTLTLTATNDIDINAPVTATGTTAGLALNAGKDIYFNEPVTLSGTHAVLAMTYGGDYHIDSANGASITLSGSDSSLTINGQAYTLIRSLDQLAALSYLLYDADGNPLYDENWNQLYQAADGHYALAQDLDASGTTYSGPVLYALGGTLAGLGHTINGLTIVDVAPEGAPSWETGHGGDALIYQSDKGSVVRDLNLTNVSVTATGGSIGGLVALNYGTISNVSLQGTISGDNTVGGLAAWNLGTIDNARLTVAIVATESNIGGVAGFNRGTITNTAVSGTVTVNAPIGGDEDYLTNSVNIGGFVGFNAGTIANSTSHVTVSATNSFGNVGGFVGYNYGTNETDWQGNPIGTGTITNSTSTGNVTVYNTNWYTCCYGGIGGFAGSNEGGTIAGSSASGNVSANTNGQLGAGFGPVGGFVGNNTANYVYDSNLGDWAPFGGTITGSTATGSVTSGGWATPTGGFAGWNSATISTSSSSGAVSGLDQTFTGGFAGGSDGTLSGNSFNTSSSGQANGVGGSTGDTPGVTPVTPPTVSPWQAAVALARPTANAAMATATTGMQQTADTPPLPSDAKAGTTQTSALAGPSVAAQIDTAGAPAPTTSWRQLQEEAERRRKRAAQQAQPVSAPKGGVGGTIRSIDVDGKHFELEKDGSPSAPAAGPAPSAQ